MNIFLSFFTDTCRWIASQSHGTKSERKEKIIKDDNVKKIARIKNRFCGASCRVIAPPLSTDSVYDLVGVIARKLLAETVGKAVQCLFEWIKIDRICNLKHCKSEFIYKASFQLVLIFLTF